VDDERYAGRVRGILTRKTNAVNYAESMADEFVAMRGRSGEALSRGAYATLFESKGLLTANGKPRWSTTQITNLMETDHNLIARRDKEVKDFNYSERYFQSPRYTKPRILSNQDWMDLRAEYIGGLDALVERAKVIADRIRKGVANPA
jgi:hypothetical protein